jgi:hypothetical protein
MRSILEAIVVFTTKIRRHAADYLRREQLVARAFYHYLKDVVAAGLRTHASEYHRNSVAWEAKYIGKLPRCELVVALSFLRLDGLVYLHLS